MQTTIDKEKCKTLTDKVAYCLCEFPHTRNSDKQLWIMLIRQFYKKSISFGRIWIEKIPLLPDMNSMRRARCVIQNRRKQYIPTEWEVAKKRKWKKSEWLRRRAK
jgi:hypothetical protein